MIRTLIIDDEEDARQALKLTLEKYCPEVQLIAECKSAKEGIAAISQLQPELIFLDIQMPQMSGFELLEQVESIDFEVIFVTAHDHYAIKAIKFSALDYLLKPIDIDELRYTLKRFKEQPRNQSQYDSVLKNIKNPEGRMERLAIPTLEGIEFLETADIIYCEAEGNYTHLFLQRGKKLLVSKKLKDFEQVLSETGFCRVHHAYLINLKHIQKYVKGEGGYVLLHEGHQAPVSRRKKEEFLRRINAW
ncbi:MAG: response regulator, partial [Bacteroidota bacterium]